MILLAYYFGRRFKSGIKFDPEFERKVIEEVLVYGSYPAIKLMWQQVKSVS